MDFPALKELRSAVRDGTIGNGKQGQQQDRQQEQQEAVDWVFFVHADAVTLTSRETAAVFAAELGFADVLVQAVHKPLEVPEKKLTT